MGRPGPSTPAPGGAAPPSATRSRSRARPSRVAGGSRVLAWRERSEKYSSATARSGPGSPSSQARSAASAPQSSDRRRARVAGAAASAMATMRREAEGRWKVAPARRLASTSPKTSAGLMTPPGRSSAPVASASACCKE